MVWFSEDVLSVEMIFENFLNRIRSVPIEDIEDDASMLVAADSNDDIVSPTLQVRLKIGRILLIWMT